MDGDMWLAFWHKGCYKGGVLGDYFYKKTFFSFISFWIYVFSCHLLGEKLPQKRKKKPWFGLWTQEKKKLIIWRNKMQARVQGRVELKDSM
jgi:hypothetical protein